jgi:calpain-15
LLPVVVMVVSFLTFRSFLSLSRMQDLTGAPTETIVFAAAPHKDTLWASLQTFVREGFLMGVATAGGGDGLVGGHAYSVLDIFQVDDSVIGEQAKVTDFFTKTAAEKSHDDDKTTMQRKLAGRERTTVRLVRIRNPWGKREWKGDFSADSEMWTNALRRKLGGSDTFAKGDGTFFMPFEDMLERFHHMDVAKTREVRSVLL